MVSTITYPTVNLQPETQEFDTRTIIRALQEISIVDKLVPYKNFDSEDVDKLIQDVESRKINDQNWIKGFIPHCSTYLNGERWEDEYGR